MERPTHAGLRHLALNVRDLDAMRRFYVDLLGFAVEWEPDPDNVYLSSGIDNLALHRVRAATDRTSPSEIAPSEIAPSVMAPVPSAQALDHLGMIVRQPEDVDRWAEYLSKSGVALAAAPRTHRDGARSCYLKDPDGNAVQIIYHPPISQKT